MDEDELTIRINEAIRKMESQEPNSEVIIFTQTQAAALIQVAEAWIALRGVWVVGGLLGSTLKWAATVVGIWLAFKAGLLQWIAHNLGGGGQ